MTILAGDVGGTKANMALVRFEERGRLKVLYQASYPSRSYPNLEEIAKRFLAAASAEGFEKPVHGCLGVAGPVRKGVVHVTNLPWVVSAESLRTQLGLEEVWLLNDMEANAHGIRTLQADEMCSLNPKADFSQEGNRALIAAGTGLGEAGLFWDGQRHHPFATEGGHSNFTPDDTTGDELLQYLRGELGHVSWEWVLSGMGMKNLYRFFRQRSGTPEPDWLREQIAKGDLGAAVSDAAVNGRDAVCVQVMDCFVHNYGSEAGNFALKMLSVGGFYIGGGIAPKILNKLQCGRFLKAFCNKGRLSSLLESIPIYVILNPTTAVQGAAQYAADRIEAGIEKQIAR